MIKFATKTKKELMLIKDIVERTMKMAGGDWAERDRADWHMDIAACHCNGNALDLDRLLRADDFNFAHDVFGIANHLNRTTGKLENHFRPRFSRKAA